MKTLISLIAALGLTAAAIAQKTTPTTPVISPSTTVPTVSDAHQKAYWKELSAYRGAEAEDQKALRTQTAAEEFMAQQKGKVQTATEAMQSDCGEKFTIDQAQAQKGDFVCIAKPPVPVAPAKPPVTPVPAPAVKPKP